ncbi:hypothetical protein E2562_005011 [Oryza meyeriana var. granulata]|uniref:Uncharacterized protein n=1 Tax=Oryza meyeriana var. granulata TaxID=110450 RepID=A0A6G1C5E1_9ORYZ|nr:hypothetical protein E2562_005011 [Oryza meyeriana var. granulata]
MKVEAIVESAGYETLTTDELFSKLKSKEIDVLSKRKLKNPTGTSSTDVPMALVSGNDELEALDDDQLALLSNKFKRVYENRRNRRRSEGCFSCGERDASSNSNDSDSEDELPKKKTDGLCFLADIKGGMCTMAVDDDEASDRSDNSSDNEIGMSIAQIKRSERFGPGYDLKYVFGEKSGGPVDEKNPPLAKYTGPPPKKEGSGVTPEGLLVEPSRSAPKKQC